MLLTGLLPFPARAVDLLPFDYIPAPAGTSALLGYYVNGSSDSLDLDGTGKVANSALDSHIFVARLTHWEMFGETPVAAQLILPFGGLEDGRLSGGPLNAPSGLFDPSLTLGFWPLNDPKNGRWIAVANYLTFPFGEHHPGQTLNVGDNRWRNDLQVGFIQKLPHDFTLDLAADYIVYGDDDEAGNGRQKLTQEPTVETFAWLAYNFDPGTWAAIGYYGSFGGRKSLNGSGNGFRTHFHQVRAAFSKFVKPDLQLTGSLGHDLSVRGGFKQDYVLQLRILKLF
jgi:hypothetical protein